ncbi:hypothetical protein [Mesorhizobium sp. WSM2239]|uniref:J domain-containing protein n=2 Tax=unclassified Mesorhizobium TaxID=325217 RepID=A0AAU8DAQ4_9HYPH
MLDIQKYTETLRRAVSSIEDPESDNIEKSYDKLRNANGRFLEKHRDSFGPEAAAQVTAALEEMIADHQRHANAESETSDPRPVETSETASPTVIGSLHQDVGAGGLGSKNNLIIGIIGAFLGVALTIATWLALPDIGLITTSPADDETAAALIASYEAHLPQVAAAATFLERVREEVITRQQNDAAELTALAGAKFVKLNAAMPELAAQSPKTLPKGSAVILRADATGYKILFNWPLCATVQYARPDLVDPVRARDVLGCSRFGVWNEAGAKW